MAPAAPLPRDLEQLLHDLRGPLNALRMQLEVLKRLADDVPGAKPSLDAIGTEIERLARLLAAAFDVVALERATLAPVALRPLVEAAVREPGLEGIVVRDGDWPTIHGDGRLLALAVGHLARNALAASAHASRPPEIGVRLRPGTVSIVVSDWGEGLPSLNPKALIRLSASRRQGTATTGLTIVDRIARLHGGSLGFDAPGEGAEVTLVLPRRQDASA